ncbi:MAG: phospholipid carrier-dependent glycosyltransferase [Gemmatimonadota bacterium]
MISATIPNTPVVSPSPKRSALRCPEFAVLTALAFLTRFWMLISPRAVVWDEVHFERFTGAYFTGKYYVDVHPPLGKLLLYAAARVLGVSGTDLATNQPTPMLRVLPALAGALIIPVVFLLMRELGASRRMATFAAAVLLLDNALLVISRVIVMDSMLTLFGVSAVYFFVAARNATGRTRWMLLVAAAIAGGMTAGTKWTGLTALALIGLLWLFDVVAERRRGFTVVLEAGLFLVVPVLAYVIPFAIHFALLHRSGLNDTTMPIPFQATLIGSRSYVPGATFPFWSAFALLHRAMMLINLGWATDFNVGASPWYSWPVAKHGIGFWESHPDAAHVRWIALFGNPAIWFPLLCGMIAVAVSAATRRVALVRYRHALIVLVVAYLLNFLPFALISRPMYLYHYFFAFIYSAMLVAFGVGALAGWGTDDESRFWAFDSRGSAALYAGFLCFAAATFVYLLPLNTGAVQERSEYLHRRATAERPLPALRDYLLK